MVGKITPWQIEVGEEASPAESSTTLLIKESSNTPTVVRRDTRNQFQWRIYPLPFPKNNYDVFVDNAKNKLIIKTTNKKYYKSISVIDLERLGIQLLDNHCNFDWKDDTLIIVYKKPNLVLEKEEEERAYRKTIK